MIQTFIFLFIIILEKTKNKFLEFNLRKKYIVFVKSSKF